MVITQNSDQRNIPLELFAPESADSLEMERISRVHQSAIYDGWIRLRKNKGALVCLAVLIILTLFAIIAPIVSPYAYYQTDYMAKLNSPSSAHLFGTDIFGRDQWTRVWYGTRISLLIGLCAAAINIFIGVIYGAVSALLGGKVDAVMQRIIEVLVGIPSLILVILFMMALPPGIWTIILALSITGWVQMARLVRAQILRMKNMEFVLAARLLGTGTWTMIRRHLIPNTVGVIIIQVMFAIPSAIFTEAFLSFIGIGLSEPQASLGVLINNGYSVLRGSPYMLIYPAVTIVLIMVCFSIVGDGLRDAFDPRMKG
ncbi:MAG: ABC transporter permease [Oscillospiraceae bacterium]|jgi:oligopeptide transport system permease protein|nr:ABC transporter permease [Oscillospiraceae bacterium]